jgi:hypothetical protein
MKVSFYSKDELLKPDQLVDLTKFENIVCVTFEPILDIHQIRFGAACYHDLNSSISLKLLEKISLGRFTKCPNFEMDYDFDPIVSCTKKGYSGKRLVAKKKSKDTSFLEYLCRNTDFSDTLYDNMDCPTRVMHIRYEILFKPNSLNQTTSHFLKYGASVWHKEGNDMFIEKQLKITAKKRFETQPIEVEIPSTFNVLFDRFLWNMVRQKGCYLKSKPGEQIIETKKEISEDSQILRTKEEILARIKMAQKRDLFGDEWHIYCDALSFEDRSKFCQNVSNDWKPRTYQEIKKEAIDYLEFAWEKANDEKGLSAARSISHYVAWMWLLGIDVDELCEEYDDYGKSQLEQIESLLKSHVK